ncbi:hypothetical protein NE237_030083 [Protea cynaroides]|uniref:Photolyase/cryptochrome alpha/beta domain-containing protein n=1 Tax=Protea cynaroides TaxID=273540 RepID=A0A9Q0JVF1_9MAGN|nr:hypothetical protein NE237_030083 [Protea cynaroides]
MLDLQKTLMKLGGGAQWMSGFSDEMLELVILALEDLREWLKSQGSNLMIRFGSAENVILELVQEVKATHVFSEEEVEYNLRRMIDIVEGSLSSVTFSWGSPQLVRWQTPFYDIKSLMDLPASYQDFKKLQYPITTPVAPPFVPGVNMELDWGTIPTLDDVKTFIGNPHKSKKSWTSIKEISAKTILREELISLSKMQSNPDQSMRNINSVENNRSNMDSKDIQKKRLRNSFFLSREGNQVGGGTDILLNALAAYLRCLEGTARDDWQEMHEKLCNAEIRSGASFGALFGSALSVGIISRRRVYFEAITYERELNARFLFPFRYSVATIAATVNAVCSMEWYWILALKSQLSREGRFSVRIWRWNGYLIQYTVVGHEGPAVLLVHGFGAFLEHYRDNIYAIADGGNHVWAITLLGFGKSEKPNIVYTELMWAELLRDFIVDIVNEPVYLVGNSIGGYFAAIVAGLWPALAKSVGLINTAGSIEPRYSSFPVTKEGRVLGGTAWFGSRLLLLYLRLNVGSILKDCYPVNTERADDWLIDEMIRASYDLGVLPVLESIFNFNLAIPLNYLLQSFGGRVIIVQGLKDPLTKSKLKVSMFREYCNGVVIRELNAGHCPHDEQPDEAFSFNPPFYLLVVYNRSRRVEVYSKNKLPALKL